MTTIIFSHPWHGSFNKAILDTVTAKLARGNKDYTVIDLPQDGFNPSYTQEELALYGSGDFIDPLVGKYQEILKATSELVIIFPVWWGTMPAILKGFFDKVMLKGFAYDYDELGQMVPMLNIGKSYVLTTSQAPSEYFTDYMNGYFMDFFLSSVGINNATWLNCDHTSHGSAEHRQAFLKRVDLEVG